MKTLLLIFSLIFYVEISAQNNPPTIKAQSQHALYGLQVCIDIETEDNDGDSVFIGFITKIPQSIFTQTNSFKKFATGSVCLTTTRGTHSDQQPNAMVIYATDKKDTTFKTVSVTIPRYPHTVRPVIEKLNYNTFKIDVKGDKNEPWEDYRGLKHEIRIFDSDNNLLLKDTNQVYTFTAPTYEKYILYVVYTTSTPALHATRDTLYPDMNVSTHSLSYQNLKVYPNPTTGTVFIENLPQDVETIVVNDVLGKELKQLQHTKSFTIENLPTGIYWVEFRNSQGVLARKKLIKTD